MNEKKQRCHRLWRLFIFAFVLYPSLSLCLHVNHSLKEYTRYPFKILLQVQRCSNKNHSIVSRFRNFCPIVIPLQSTMTVILPSNQGAQSNYNPFPDALPTFAGIDETVTRQFFLLYLQYYASYLPENNLQLEGF